MAITWSGYLARPDLLTSGWDNEIWRKTGCNGGFNSIQVEDQFVRLFERLSLNDGSKKFISRKDMDDWSTFARIVNYEVFFFAWFEMVWKGLLRNMEIVECL